MSNKNSLVLNNSNLLEISNTIQNLPLADDVKNGQYAWGKYTTEDTPVIITADNLNEQSDMSILIQVYSSNIDVGDLTAADFIGTTMTREGESYPTITFTSATECVHTYSASTDPETTTWDYDNGIITVNSYSTNTWYSYHFNLDISGFNKTIGSNVFSGYVVSDSADEYPDAGTQGEFYYEKLDFSIEQIIGITKAAKDTFTFASDTYLNNATLTHSLGAIPKLVIVKDEKSQVVASGKYTYIAEIFGYANNALYKNGGGNYETQSFSNYYDVTASNIRFNIASSTRSYCAGVEYTMYTFA